MKKSVRLLTLVLCLAMLVTAFAACGGNDADPADAADAKVEENGNGVFRVGLECGYAPFNWTQTTDANGGVPIKGTKEFAGGYDIEIAKRIAEGLGKELVVVKTEWDGLVPALLSGTIDAIIAGMSPTAERKETINFSDNYYKSDLVIVVRKDSPYVSAQSIQDFAGAKLTAQLNTFHYTVIDQIEGVNKQTAATDFPAMRVALQAGTIDGYVSERPDAVSAAAANPDITFVAFEGDNGFVTSDDDTAIAVGLRKEDTEMLEKINEILADIPEDERLEIMDTAIANQPAAE
ncbi:MAG: transporter substrate-binding domain-containing protein [Clostridia bacterium]